MDAALLIVLVGELVAPLGPHVVSAFPTASGERIELVKDAPAGRDVVWVTAPSRDDVVLTLHIAGETGDLRRELKFSRSDSVPARGRAVAFAIAAMRAERKPESKQDAPVETPPPVATPVSHWFLSLRGVGAIALPQVEGQGGGVLEAQYLFPFHLAAGLGSSFMGGSVTGASWLQPAMWVSGSLRFDTGAFIPRVSVGVGAMASIIKDVLTTTTTWQPYFRAAADLTWRFVKPHGVILGIAANFTTRALSFTTFTPNGNGNNGNGNGNANGNQSVTGTLGPAWLAFELGYAVDF